MVKADSPLSSESRFSSLMVKREVGQRQQTSGVAEGTHAYGEPFFGRTTTDVMVQQVGSVANIRFSLLYLIRKHCTNPCLIIDWRWLDSGRGRLRSGPRCETDGLG